MSLTHALCAIADRVGYAIDLDDLNAALGLSWMSIAVPSEPDPACWPMYARDAFLVEAGRLFGMTIRDMHPPEAARGLSDAAEFRQHFDASYRPLVLRALEHDQTVLAWQGWPGDMRLLWGIITGTSDAGVGLRGRVACPSGRAAWPSEAPPCPSEPPRDMPAPSARANRTPEVVTLEHPPVQLYVVETVVATQPDPQELLDLAHEHAKQVLSDTLHDRFGVITGPAAYDAWIEHCENAGRAQPAEASKASRRAKHDLRVAEAPKAPCRAQPDLPATEQHRRLVASVIGMHQSASRFLGRLRTRTSQPADAPLADLEKLCEDIIRALREGVDPAHVEAGGARKGGSQDRFVGVLEQARDLTKAMPDTLGAA